MDGCRQDIDACTRVGEGSYRGSVFSGPRLFDGPLNKPDTLYHNTARVSLGPKKKNHQMELVTGRSMLQGGGGEHCGASSETLQRKCHTCPTCTIRASGRLSSVKIQNR